MNDRNYTEEEALLSAWLMLDVSIRENRLLDKLSYNEMIVYHLLTQDKRNGGIGLTASELCDSSKLLKSLMNRTLIGMEKKGYILRKSSEEDKRKILVTLTDPIHPDLLKEHVRVLGIMRSVTEALGKEEAREMAILLEKARMLFT